MSSSSSLLESSSIAPAFLQSKSDTQFPVETKACVVNITGIPTDILISIFSDSVLILISQTSKLSTWYFASADIDSAQFLSDSDLGNISYQVDTLLGRRDDSLLQILPRQLIERIQKIWPGKNLVLSVGLKDSPVSPPILKEILQNLSDQNLL